MHHAYICFHREEQSLWMSYCSEDRMQFIFIFTKWGERKKNFSLQCDLVILWLFSLICFAILLYREVHSPEVWNPAPKKRVIRYTVLKLSSFSHHSFGLDISIVPDTRDTKMNKKDNFSQEANLLWGETKIDKFDTMLRDMKQKYVQEAMGKSARSSKVLGGRRRPWRTSEES